MSLTVVFRETAVRNLARIRREDKDLFARTRRTAASLADQPYPEGAIAWGATGVYRLHAGDIRILYEVDDEAATVYIINIGFITRNRSHREATDPGQPLQIEAHITAVVTPDLGVFAVAAAGVLWTFRCVVEALPEHCLRRRLCAIPLVVAIFRI